MRKSVEKVERQTNEIRQSLDLFTRSVGSLDAAEAIQGVGDSAERGVARIQALGGILEDHLQLTAIGVAGETRSRHGSEFATVEHDAAGGGVEQPHHHHRCRRLAASRLADQPDALARFDVEANAVDRAEGPIMLGEVFDLQQRRAGGNRYDRRCGCREQIPQADAGPWRRLHQPRAIGMLRGRKDLFRGGRLDDAAALHDDQAVAIGRGEAEIVGDEDRRHVARSSELDDQVHHRLLRGDVEPGRRLVGDQQLRAACQRDGDHDALAHATGKLERKGIDPLLRLRDAHEPQRFDRPLARGGRTCLIMADQHVGNLASDGADRVETGARVLEDHRNLRAAHRLHRRLGRLGEIAAVEGDRAVRDPPGAIENLHHGVRGD